MNDHDTWSHVGNQEGKMCNTQVCHIFTQAVMSTPHSMKSTKLVSTKYTPFIHICSLAKFEGN